MTNAPTLAIVLVDDDPVMLTVLTLALRPFAQNYDLIPVQDGAAALAHVAQRAVALVITDYAMPTMDGVTLIVAMKALAPHCPVVLLSGTLTPAIRSSARGAGAVFALRKPVLFEPFVALVQAALAADQGVAAGWFPIDQRDAGGGDSSSSVCLSATVPVANQRRREVRWLICS